MAEVSTTILVLMTLSIIGVILLILTCLFGPSLIRWCRGEEVINLDAIKDEEAELSERERGNNTKGGHMVQILRKDPNLDYDETMIDVIMGNTGLDSDPR